MEEKTYLSNDWTDYDQWIVEACTAFLMSHAAFEALVSTLPDAQYRVVDAAIDAYEGALAEVARLIAERHEVREREEAA